MVRHRAPRNLVEFAVVDADRFDQRQSGLIFLVTTTKSNLHSWNDHLNGSGFGPGIEVHEESRAPSSTAARTFVGNTADMPMGFSGVPVGVPIDRTGVSNRRADSGARSPNVVLVGLEPVAYADHVDADDGCDDQQQCVKTIELRHCLSPF